MSLDNIDTPPIASELSQADWIRSALDNYSARLIRYAWFITEDIELARDIVQDTFVRLCNGNRRQIEPHLAEWLFTVCRHRALDVLRKERRMQPLNEADWSQEASHAPSPSTQAEDRETTNQILKILASLPRHQQEVVRLKFENGLSYAEISRATQLTVSNVGFLIHTALKNIRHQLQRLDQTNSGRTA